MQLRFKFRHGRPPSRSSSKSTIFLLDSTLCYYICYFIYSVFLLINLVVLSLQTTLPFSSMTQHDAAPVSRDRRLVHARQAFKLVGRPLPRLLLDLFASLLFTCLIRLILKYVRYINSSFYYILLMPWQYGVVGVRPSLCVGDIPSRRLVAFPLSRIR